MLNVNEDGIQRLEHQDLVNAGLDLSGIAASSIAITSKGVAIARHIRNTTKKGRWSANSVLEFIGGETERTRRGIPFCQSLPVDH